jgi:hypothetical protein
MAEARHRPDEHVRQSRPEDTGHRTGSTSGRPTSWIAVVTIIVGFIVGGFGVIFMSSAPWLFWLGAVMVIGGGIFALATGIMDDVH